MFVIIGNTEEGYFITLGKYRCTSERHTIEQCEDMIKRMDWELVFTISSIAADHTYENKLNTKN